MAPEWIYLLKVNVGIALFYAFYKLFCCRDTFFRWRRFAILSFLGISFLYPFVNIQDWIKEQPNMVELADYYASWMWSEEVVVTPTTQVAQTPDLMTTAMYIYFIGVVALSIRFLIQLCSILYMRGKGTVTYLKGQRIISIPTEVNPFSFFQWIFIHQQRINEENLDEILMHEQTHAKQWHSIDVVLSEIINIVCWFNPFSWLLKNEIRLNLEYLADNQVTEIVEDAKVYQYHLLGLASQKRQTGLYNNFNVSHLKHRIIMMNKKRTCTAGRIKYALFAPLAIALLLASNISCVSNEKKAEQTAETPTATPALQEVESTSQETEPPTEKLIFTVVEEMPEFTGGMGECMKFINKNIQYPPEAIEKEIQGRVIVQMVITDEGDVTDAKVVRG
ncbi:MAG: energy transducer TonB, partial [Bacteroidaceae bacterium]|nr:energy transducer TonB [Bacteroidaceae bacterium]